MGIQAMKVPTVFTAIDKFSGVVGTMTRNMSKFNDAAQASAMRTSTFLNRTGTQMLGAGIGMATGIGYAVNEAVKFEKAMATVNTTIDNTTPEMIKKMGDEVLQMSKKIPKPISELTDALYDVVSAGIDARYSMTVLNASGRLAVSGLGTTKESVDVLTSSINSFNLDANESESIANKVFKAVKYGKTTVSQLAESFGSSSALVKNSNVSLEEYLATTAVLTTTGMTASRAQTQVASAVTALIKPSKSMQAVLSSLGAKDIPKFIKQNGGLVKTLEMVSKRADQMGILTSKAFGRKEGFSAMLSLLGPLRSKFNEVYADMNSKADSMAIAFEKQTKTVSAGVQIMKNKMTILGITIGNQLIPRVNGFLDRLNPIIEKTTKWMDKNEGLSNTLLTATLVLLGLGVAAKVGAVLFFGLSKVIGIVTAVTQAYTFVSTMAALANVSFATALWGVISALWAYVSAQAAALWPITLLVAGIGLLIWSVIDMTKNWRDWNNVILLSIGPLGWIILLIQKIGEHWENITSLFQGEGMIGAIKGIGTLIEDVILGTLIGALKIMGRLTSFIPGVGSSFKEMASDLGGLKTNIASQLTIGNATGMPQFSTFGGQIPSWNTSGKTENLAGKNQNDMRNILNSIQGKGGTLDLRLTAPDGYGLEADASNVKGIDVKTSTTKKSSKND